MSEGGHGADTDADAATDVAKARALVELDRFDEAAELLAKRLAREPDDVRAWVELTRCRLENREPEAAVDAAREVVRLSPEYAAGHLMLGLGLARTERHPEAVLAVEEAVRLEPEAGGAHYHHAEVLLLDASPRTRKELIARREQALEAARQGVRCSPQDPDNHRMVALALEGLGRLGEAAATREHVVRLDPADAEARGELASVQGRIRAAKLTTVVTALSEQLADRPSDATAQRDLRAALHRMLRRARLVTLLWGLGVAAPAARVFTSEGAPDSLPAPLGERIWALVVIAVVYGVVGWLAHRRVPRGTWRGLRMLVRRHWALSLAPLGAGWCVLGVVTLLAVPWSDRATSQLVLHATWVPVALSAVVDRSVGRWRHTALYG